MTDKNKNKRDAVKTRNRILERATMLFAEKGYEGTSISQIVSATGNNKRMIYHYFGDKKGLYRAIFVQQWGLLKEWFDRAFHQHLEEAGSKPIDPLEWIAEALNIFFDFIAGNQHFVRLMMWEGLEGGEISRSIWKDVRGPLYIQMEFLIKQAQEEGRIQPNLDAAQLVVTFLGAISFYFGYAPTLGDMIGEDPLTPQALNKRKEHLLQILQGLSVSN